jgi:hypothetical protein
MPNTICDPAIDPILQHLTSRRVRASIGEEKCRWHYRFERKVVITPWPIEGNGRCRMDDVLTGLAQHAIATGI